jgi:hypothetical protein
MIYWIMLMVAFGAEATVIATLFLSLRPYRDDYLAKRFALVVAIWLFQILAILLSVAMRIGEASPPLRRLAWWPLFLSALLAAIGTGYLAGVFAKKWNGIGKSKEAREEAAQLMNISPILRQFRQLSFKEKSAITFVVAGSMVLLSFGVGLWITNLKNITIAAKQAEIESQQKRSQMQEQETAIEQNRLNVERLAATNKAQAEALRALKAELATKQVRGKLKIVSRQRTQEQQDYEAKIKAITTSTEDACRRWLRNCVDAKHLGLRNANAPCDCVTR